MKFILLTHERELTKKTNTGRLVKEALGEKVEIIVWKRKAPDARLVNLLETKQAALLYPESQRVGETMVTPLNSYQYCVIIDSTWQEARKIFNRSAYLKNVDKVSLDISKSSEFKLRRNQVEGGLSTAECVIEILKLVNADVDEQTHLLETSFASFNTK